METYLSKVLKLRRAAGEHAPRKDNVESESVTSSDEQQAEAAKLRLALSKLKGRDRVGVAGETAAVIGSAAAGAALAGSAASAAGASTLLGSTTLAGALGGVFVTATPIGWVLGSAAVASALGYGVMRLVRSGSKQDSLREEVSDRLNARTRSLEEPSPIDRDLELKRLIDERVAAGVITPDAAHRVVVLVEKGYLSRDLAVERIRAIDSNGSTTD